MSEALKLLREICEPSRVLIFARAVATPEEKLSVVRLEDTSPNQADMRTVVLIGSSATRIIERVDAAPIVYTPRAVPE